MWRWSTDHQYVLSNGDVPRTNFRVVNDALSLRSCPQQNIIARKIAAGEESLCMDTAEMQHQSRKVHYSDRTSPGILERPFVSKNCIPVEN